MITDIPRCSRVCSVKGTEILPGQVVYSALLEDGDNYKRIDFSTECWKGIAALGPNAVGWWKSKIPAQHEKKNKLAPNDILLKLFDQLADQLEKQEMRYVLTLLLVRRRLFRLEREEDAGGVRKLIVYCPKQDCSYEVITAIPSEERIEQVQNELAQLFQ